MLMYLHYLFTLLIHCNFLNVSPHFLPLFSNIQLKLNPLYLNKTFPGIQIHSLISCNSNILDYEPFRFIIYPLNSHALIYHVCIDSIKASLITSIPLCQLLLLASTLYLDSHIYIIVFTSSFLCYTFVQAWSTHILS